jgi:signal peptide peptidase SppA
MQPLACDLWLMERSALQQLAGFAVSTLRVDAEMAKAVAAVTPRRQKAIGVIPVHGPLEARPSFVGEMMGLSSYQRIGEAFEALMADDSVAGIVFDVCSPGGSVYGCSELANTIYNARGRKPIVAVASPLAASGAYWLAAAADRVIVTPSGDVGSVGVVAQHVDLSAALEKEGEKVTTIRSEGSPYKQETNPYEPLSEDGRAHLQARADSIFEQFVADLSKFRGVTKEHVREHFGKGRLVASEDSVPAKMADRRMTFRDAVGRLVDDRVRLGREAASDVWEAPTRRDRLRETAAQISARADLHLT